MNWFLYDNGLRHERVKDENLIRKEMTLKIRTKKKNLAVQRLINTQPTLNCIYTRGKCKHLHKI